MFPVAEGTKKWYLGFLLFVWWWPMSANAAGGSESLISNARVFLPLPGQSNGVGYFEWHNPSAGDLVVIAVTSPQADRVELHDHIHEEGIIKMREVEQLRVPAGGRLLLAPGGLHLMLIKLSRDLQSGDRVELILTLADGSRHKAFALARHRLEGQLPADILKGGH